jgi:uncharacterized protein (DUF58 family)
MNAPPLQLDPGLLEKAKDLRLFAQSLVCGFVDGLHRSPFPGAGQEFASFRSYVPGDPLKLVDWKAWGRSDSLFVRQFDDDTNTRCHLFLDVSRSMDFGEGSANKFAYARVLVAVLSTIMEGQHDAPGLALLGSNEDSLEARWFPPSSRSDHVDHLIGKLGELQADGLRRDLPRVWEILNDCETRSISILISDSLFPLESLREFLHQLRIRRQEILFFHLLSPQEIDPELADDIVLVDSETGRELSVDGSAIAGPYAEDLQRWFAGIESVCHEVEADYCRLVTDQPLDVGLMRYFELRQRTGL